ncbi:putative late blight resistance protein homolog R1A-10 isoform X2 [Salvia splendens]|uniref:putative late blight resistance protein homolog R1A-10 isoform X2 n=1 Tax=Salvia splendens TaxID=180675 RepID=UPI001C25B214|nr:putative late blight resistance protein homolog R1A-10 isoform X2 [Salvia splendens]
MAYNLQSLLTIIEQSLGSKESDWILHYYKPQLKSLLQKASNLQENLEKHSLPIMKSLERKIREVSRKAEDIIESHMILHFSYITQELQQVTQEIDYITDQVAKLMDGDDKKTRKVSSRSGASSTSAKSIVVGVDADLKLLTDWLFANQSKLEIVPIVGMAGIGKTTLAQKLYEDPSIVSCFACAWATISQDYNMREILASLLRCIIGKDFDKHSGKGSDELKVILHQSLFGKRYMIVLDDIWSTKFWYEMRNYFPDNNNGSRIVITARESGVANFAGTKQHKVEVLSESVSWDLLRRIVFGEKECPHELKGIGTKIVSGCHGLPLAIHVIGGLLSKVERSRDVWEKIANDVTAAIAKTDEQFNSILSLSYNHLPNHLKPCFLYMGAFPEDYRIKGSRLIRMWLAEGFVKSNCNRSLEKEAEDFLHDLVERNLFLVREYKYGKPKSYSMHDMLRDLCIMISDEDKFLHVQKGRKVTFSNPCRVSVQASHGMEDFNASAESMSPARSFIGIGCRELPSGAFFTLRLLRVLDVMDMWFAAFPREIFEFANLRFLAFSCNARIPSGISRLCYLQTLITRSLGIDVPSELWQLSELRNLNVKGFELLNDVELKHSVLVKVQMISSVFVPDSVYRRGFFKTIPNIKKLGIVTDEKTSTEIDLSHLQELKEC